MGYSIPLKYWHILLLSILVKLQPADGGSKYSCRLEVSLLAGRVGYIFPLKYWHILLLSILVKFRLGDRSSKYSERAGRISYNVWLMYWHILLLSILVKLRLAQGGSRYSGRLEVSLLDEWGTVSGKEFGTAEAEVVCRYLKLK